MESIAPTPPQTQEQQIVQFRYVSRLTPERVKSLSPLEKEEALIEFLTFFSLILSVIYNPVAKEATRLLALDVIVTQVQRSARKLIGSVTDKSPTYAPETEKRLGLSKNTISSGYKSLEKAGVLLRTHRTDEITRQDHLDIAPTPVLFTKPGVIRDKKKREAPKPKLDVKPLDVTKLCLECGSHDLRISCRKCGSFIDLGEVEHTCEGDMDAAVETPEEELQTTPQHPTHHKICDGIQEPGNVTNLVTSEKPTTPPEPEHRPSACSITLSCSHDDYQKDPLHPANKMTSGLKKPAPQEVQEYPTDLQVRDELLLDIAGDAPDHIVMNTNPAVPKKYLTVHRPLSLEDVRMHLAGTKTVGATLAKASGTTRTLCFDADTTENWQQLQDAATLLQISGCSPLLEPSPAGRGGHLWLIFTSHVQTCAAVSQVCSIAPQLLGIPEYWPRGNGYKVRLPLGAYVTPTFGEWCHLYDATGREISTLLLTPADLLPDAPPLDRPCNCDEQSVTLPEHEGVDDYHRRKYPQNHFWFTWTDEQLAAWYNEHTRLTDLLPPERNGNGLASWRGERTASVAYTKDSTGWVDFGAAARREDGKQDGGDCLELLARLLQKSKSAVMSDLGKLLVREARAALEGAAKSGEPPPAWVEPFMTDAGWKHYDKLRQDGHRDKLRNVSQSDQNPQADDAPQQGGVVGFQNAAVISQSAKEQPTWESLMQVKNERGLPVCCSQCGSFASWYGAGGMPYCDEHWQEQKMGRS